MPTIHKFRPVLTEEQMRFLSNSLAQSSDPVGVSIRRVLVPLLAKIEVGAINPAYKLSEIYTQKLESSQRRKMYENGEMTPEEESLYETEVLGL